MKPGVCTLFFIILFCSIVHADTYIPVGHPLYDYFRLLEAEGLIPSSQLSTLPLSRLEGARLTTEAAKNAEKSNSRRVGRIVARLEKEFKKELESDGAAFFRPAEAADVQYLYSDRRSFFAQKNRDGVEVRKGSNAILDVTNRFDSRYVGGILNPEINVYDDAVQATLKKGYLLANLGREEFMFGKESAWWGPGQNGSILLSTNAEPLTAIRVSNSIPYFPFGIGLRGTFFITQLESDRKDVARPLLQGIRIDVKPAPFIEFGLSKTAMFGGEGREQDFETFIRSLFGINENVDPNDPNALAGETGDQRAGFDVKIILPWALQPVTLYLDAAGEDQRAGVPSKWFYVAGFYLPRVANLDMLELWGEYATNYDSDQPGKWYAHHVYTQGYTYHGRIIGHYMGSDAKDIFLKGRYNLDTAAISVSYEKLQKYSPAALVWEDYRISLLKEFSDRTDLTLSAGYSREERTSALLQVSLRHQF